MRFWVRCSVCGCTLSVRGSDEPDTNSYELNESDPNWDDACGHLKDGGPYEIVEVDYDDETEV